MALLQKERRASIESGGSIRRGSSWGSGDDDDTERERKSSDDESNSNSSGSSKPKAGALALLKELISKNTKRRLEALRKKKVKRKRQIGVTAHAPSSAPDVDNGDEPLEEKELGNDGYDDSIHAPSLPPSDIAGDNDDDDNGKNPAATEAEDKRIGGVEADGSENPYAVGEELAASNRKRKKGGAAAGGPKRRLGNDGEMHPGESLDVDRARSVAAALNGDDPDDAESKADDDRAEDLDDDRHYVPYAPAGWGPVNLSFLPFEHREKERIANQQRPPFCFLCEMTQSLPDNAGVAPLSNAGTATASTVATGGIGMGSSVDNSTGQMRQYRKLLKYASDNMHRMSYTSLCMKMQRRYMKHILPLIVDEEDANIPTMRPPSDADNKEEKGGGGDSEAKRRTASREKQYYWSLRQIYEHFRSHAPSERWILEDQLRDYNTITNYLMANAIFLVNPNNGSKKFDLKATRALLTVQDRRQKTAMILHTMRPDSNI